MSQSPRKAWMESVIEYSKELRLPMIAQHLEAHVQEANQLDTCYEEFLALLLQKECDARVETSRISRIRLAQFTHKKYLEDLSVSDLPEDAQKKLKQLKSLDFIREGRNVILSGNPGTGKATLASDWVLKLAKKDTKYGLRRYLCSSTRSRKVVPNRRCEHFRIALRSMTS